MRKSAVALLLFVALAGAQPVLAQTRPGGIEISAYLGGEYFQFEGIDSGPTYGVRLGGSVTEHVQFEAYFDQTDTNDDLDQDIDIDIDSYGVDFLWNGFTESEAHVPYILLGVGHGELKTEGESDKYDYWEVGVGYRYFFNRVVAIRAELRTQGTDDNGDVGFDDFNTKGTVGVSLVFGGSR